MKKNTLSFLTLLLVFGCHETFSQTEKGTWLLGGSANVSRSKSGYGSSGDNDYYYFSYGVSPQLMYLPADRLAIGLSLNFNHSKALKTDYDSKSSSFFVGPVVRYYLPVSEKWAVFPQVKYTFGTQITHSPIFDSGGGIVVIQKTKYTYGNFNAGFGTTYFLNKNIGLEGILQYTKSNGKTDIEGVDDSFASTINFSVGFQIYFGRKAE
jgi:hypothetical protein